MMKRRLLSIFTSVSLVASTLAMGAYAVPTVAGTFETAVEQSVPETPFIENSDSQEALKGPQPVMVAELATELNTEFGAPELFEGAFLMSELEGEGTKESPYLVGTADDLKLVSNNVNQGIASSAYYKLTADIDLGGIEWTPIGHHTKTDKYSVSFRGVFDGDGHTVSNFKITKDSTPYLGLFGLTTGAQINNLNVDNATISVTSDSNEKIYAGIVAARFLTNEESLSTSASITNCKVTNSSIKIESNGCIYAGGISGVIIGGFASNSEIFSLTIL